MSHPRRVFVDFPVGTHPQHGTEVALSKSDSHHFRSVLRLTQGSAITVVDRASAKEFDAILSSAEDPVIARVLHEKRRAQPTSRVASLTFALAKGKNTDLVCEKACELGVGHIVL
jgi:RsmE family RNA methyltransferase